MATEKTKVSKDLIPIINAKRTTGPFGYFNVWIGLSIIIATFAVGGEGISQMKLGYVLAACIIGNILLGIFVSITGDIGVEHGISFPMYIKVLFGPRGIVIPSILRAIYGAIWFGIQTYFGSTAINVIVRQLTGFDSWLVWYVVFAVVQIINTACGFKAIEKFANIASPSILIIAVFMLFRLNGMAGEQGLDLWNTVAGGGDTAFAFNAFIVLLIMNMTYWASSSADSQTLTRYTRTTLGERNWFRRNKSALFGHLLALPLGQTFMIAVGAISMLVVNNYNPIDAMQSMASGFLLFVFLLMIVFAQWSTNAGGNLLPPSITIVDLSKSKISYPVAVVITGIIGSITQPWVLMDNLSTFLAIIGTLWASFAGMTFADYYLLRKRKLNIPELYQAEGMKGQYVYQKGWNWAGIISLVVSMACGFLFSQYSYFVGFLVGGALYYLLGKHWWYKQYRQQEFAAGDELLGTSAGRDWLYDEEKDTVYPSV